MIFSVEKYIFSFLAGSDFCHLLTTFAKSLNPNLDGWNVGPDLDTNHLTHFTFHQNARAKVNRTLETKCYGSNMDGFPNEFSN